MFDIDYYFRLFVYLYVYKGIVMALTARISGESDDILKELVNKTGKSKIEIIDEALKSYRFHERMGYLIRNMKGLDPTKKLGIKN